MTDKQLNLFIAKKLYTDVIENDEGHICYWVENYGYLRARDFCNDFAAIHEAYTSLTRSERDLVNTTLAEMCAAGYDYSELEFLDNLVNAPAKLRAQAFVKTFKEHERGIK